METPNFSVIVHKNQLNLMGLVHAMRSNGPLPQVQYKHMIYVYSANTPYACLIFVLKNDKSNTLPG